MRERVIEEKPKNVTLAMRLLWTSFALTILAVCRDPNIVGPTGRTVLLTVVVFTMGLLAFLNVQINAGKNWARITYAVLLVFGCLSSCGVLFSGQILHIATMSLQTGLQGYALWLLFTKPGKQWFSR